MKKKNNETSLLHLISTRVSKNDLLKGAQVCRLKIMQILKST